MFPPLDQLTEDGFDLQFGTNVVGEYQRPPDFLAYTKRFIGHFLLAKLLLPALLSGKETSPDSHARIMTTSSDGAYYYTIDWASFKDGQARKKLGTQKLYFQSKFVSSSWYI